MHTPSATLRFVADLSGLSIGASNCRKLKTNGPLIRNLRETSPRLTLAPVKRFLKGGAVNFCFVFPLSQKNEFNEFRALDDTKSNKQAT